MLKKQATLSILLLTTVLCMVPSSCAYIETPMGVTSGYINSVRGGFGVVAVIDTHSLASEFSKNTVQWTIEISGGFVLFGSSSGSAIPKTLTHARSSLFPPAVGFGPVTITVTVFNQGSVVSHVQRSGFMIGPFVLAVH